MFSSFTPEGAEIAAPTTIETSQRFEGSVRVTNSTGSNALISTAIHLTATTSVNNASLQSDIILDDASFLKVGDIVVEAGVPASTTISSISGNTITLSAALTAAIDGSVTPVEIDFYRNLGNFTMIGNTTEVVRCAGKRIYASAATVLLVGI